MALCLQETEWETPNFAIEHGISSIVRCRSAFRRDKVVCTEGFLSRLKPLLQILLTKSFVFKSGPLKTFMLQPSGPIKSAFNKGCNMKVFNGSGFLLFLNTKPGFIGSSCMDHGRRSFVRRRICYGARLTRSLIFSLSRARRKIGFSKKIVL